MGSFPPDLQLSSTTCWMSPPRNGTRTSSKCSRFLAEARPVTRGTYFREFVGPAHNKARKTEQIDHFSLNYPLEELKHIHTHPSRAGSQQNHTAPSKGQDRERFLSNTTNQTRAALRMWNSKTLTEPDFLHALPSPSDRKNPSYQHSSS